MQRGLTNRMGYKDVHVANTPDLRDGEMKEISIDETRILLARTGDRFYAVSATCPHYGAPLAEGVLCGTRIVCPRWRVAWASSECPRSWAAIT